MLSVKQRWLTTRTAAPIFLLALVVSGYSLYSWFQSSEIRSHFARAEEYVKQAKGPEARAEWEAILKKDPGNLSAQELLAEYYFSRQNWAKAADAFAALHQLAPEKAHVLCKQAACLLRMDDQKFAVATAQREIKKDPNCVAALGLVASLMTQRPGANVKELLTYLRRLARLQPDDLTIQRMYAETLSNQYLYDELRPVLATLLRLDPNDIQAYNLLGFADLARPDQPQGATEAVKHFQKSLTLSATNPGAHFGLGRAFLALQRPREAIQELEIAKKDLPGFARLHQELVKAYRLNGETANAKRAQEQFVQLQRLVGEERNLIVRCAAYPKNAEYPIRLGRLYLQIGNPLRAFYYLQQASKLKPNDPKIQGLLHRATQALEKPAVSIPGAN